MSPLRAHPTPRSLEEVRLKIKRRATKDGAARLRSRAREGREYAPTTTVMGAKDAMETTTGEAVGDEATARATVKTKPTSSASGGSGASREAKHVKYDDDTSGSGASMATTDFERSGIENHGDAPTSRCATPMPSRIEMELDADEETENGYAGVQIVCRRTVRGWGNAEETPLEVSPVRGGITNALFKVARKTRTMTRRGEDDDASVARVVVVRVFGKGTDRFITHRKVQGETSHVLNEHGFGAKVLGVFTNGLVEEFIEAESVAPEDLASGGALLRRVAAQMRRLHKEVAPDLAPRVFRREMKVSRQHAIWDTLHLWFDLAYGVANDPNMFKSDPRKRAVLNELKIDDDARRLLFDVVRGRCDRVDSQTVYCHNDIHAGNFLLNKQTDNLTLIDYEYADYGPRAFDMANLFCEFAGFECNYDQFPTAKLRREFYIAYLPSSASDADVDGLEAEVAAWTPVTHVFWALWAVIQAKYSIIDFDFLGFAAMRMKVFRASVEDEAAWVPTNAALGRAFVPQPEGWNATAEGTL